jgi:hypothetical protein
MNAVDLLRKKVVPFFESDFKNVPKEKGICEVFGMEVEGFVNVDSYGIRTIQSDVLRVFTQPSYDVIGFAMGTREAPKVAMRFIDYKSAWLIVPANEDQPELWCGGKYPEKISYSTPFKVKSLSGNQALVELLEDERAFLSIELSPRKELYLKNLIVGDEKNLILCQETGCIVTPRLHWKDFKEKYLDLDKKDRAEALTILRGINNGRLEQTHDRVQKFFEKNMEFARFSGQALPKNPLARNVWLSALGGV